MAIAADRLELLVLAPALVGLARLSRTLELASVVLAAVVYLVPNLPQHHQHSARPRRQLGALAQLAEVCLVKSRLEEDSSATPPLLSRREDSLEALGRQELLGLGLQLVVGCLGTISSSNQKLLRSEPLLQLRLPEPDLVALDQAQLPLVVVAGYLGRTPVKRRRFSVGSSSSRRLRQIHLGNRRKLRRPLAGLETIANRRQDSSVRRRTPEAVFSVAEHRIQDRQAGSATPTTRPAIFLVKSLKRGELEVSSVPPTTLIRPEDYSPITTMPITRTSRDSVEVYSEIIISSNQSQISSDPQTLDLAIPVEVYLTMRITMPPPSMALGPTTRISKGLDSSTTRRAIMVLVFLVASNRTACSLLKP